MPKRSQVSEALEDSLENTQEQTTKSSGVFDFDKYRINNSPVTKTVAVEDEEFEVTVKPLTWSKKNQLLSKCLKWDTNGNTVFDGDAYVRECLKEMLVNAPWGKTTELFLISIDERLGNALEQLVPAAFGAGVTEDTENLKDG
tara:strand:- start:3351 stop:3779 length:429 start_codon:yes stop_codon:yes gene_type:complete